MMVKLNNYNDLQTLWTNTHAVNKSFTSGRVSASDILNFDVTNIFNISNNQQVQGLGSKESNITNNLNKVDDYTQKYIKMLEDKIQQLESK